MQSRPRLIGLDWGTSSLRAYLLNEHGAILAQKACAWGVLSSAGSDFAGIYAALVGDWRSADPDLPTIASGMIGSTEGWVRAPYCLCPAGAAELAGSLVVIFAGDRERISVIPGVEYGGAAPNVMRGEETQIVGALALRPEIAQGEITLVLPGTHAKWVHVRAGRIIEFTTYLTGELFAILRDHSILGRPFRAIETERSDSAQSPGANCPPAAFDRGVEFARTGRSRGIGPLLFLTRSLVLRGSLAANESMEFLSGVLIGDEVRSGLEGALPVIALAGDGVLCERYARVLAAFGVTGVPIVADAAPAGLWNIALRAGLVGTARTRA